MGFGSGTISFRRFIVVGKSPKAIDQELLDRLSANAVREDRVGILEEDYGWSGGRHVLDGEFSFENNVYAETLHFALRIDTNKVPAELKKAYQIIEEEAAAKSNPSGFISKNQRKEAREAVRRKLDDELRSGKFRRSKQLPVLWDIASATVYCGAMTPASTEKLCELFERTFALELIPLSAGSLALRKLESRGARRGYEDAQPTRFVHGPEGENQRPDYPWTMKGEAPKDFFGNEFLLWLWHSADADSGNIETEAGSITVFFDRALDLDCAYAQTGKAMLRSEGVSRMPEAREALRTGKVPRKAGLMLHTSAHQFTLAINAESLAIGSLKLPDVEDAENARVLFEERVAMIREFGKALDELYGAFLKERANGHWEGQSGAIRRWISKPKRELAAVG